MKMRYSSPVLENKWPSHDLNLTRICLEKKRPHAVFSLSIYQYLFLWNLFP